MLPLTRPISPGRAARTTEVLRLSEHRALQPPAPRPLEPAEARLLAVGRLAGGVAHDVNSPLASLKSGAATLSEYVAELRVWFERLAGRDDPGTRALVEQTSRELGLAPEALLADLEELAAEATGGAERIAELISALNVTARRGESREWFDAGRAVRDAAVLFDATHRRRCELDLHVAPLPAVHGDPAALRHVLVELLEVTLSALGGRGRLACRANLEDDRVRILIFPGGEVPAVENPLVHREEMTVAWQVVQRMGGRLTWVPEGAACVVELPTDGPSGATTGAP